MRGARAVSSEIVNEPQLVSTRARAGLLSLDRGACSCVRLGGGAATWVQPEADSGKQGAEPRH